MNDTNVDDATGIIETLLTEHKIEFKRVYGRLWEIGNDPNIVSLLGLKDSKLYLYWRIRNKTYPEEQVDGADLCNQVETAKFMNRLSKVCDPPRGPCPRAESRLEKS